SRTAHTRRPRTHDCGSGSGMSMATVASSISTKRRVLVVDDEDNVTHLVSSALRFDGFETVTADSGTAALAKVAEVDPDLIVVEVHLTATEFELLRYLMRNERVVLSKTQILDRVWKYDFQGQSNIVELYIGYLRKKVDNVEPKLIHTIRGAGYVIKAPRT